MKRSTPLAAACAALLALAACQDAPLATNTASKPTTRIPTAPPSTDVRTGWIYGPDGKPMQVTFSVHEGLAILDGDINLGPANQVAGTREALTRASGPLYGVFINGSSYRWSSGTVPYVIDGSLNSTHAAVIGNALNHVRGLVAGVSFTPRTTESSYVVFKLHASVCNSNIGRQGGSQTINLTSGCAYSMGTVAHEVLHALGMWHEQSRCDRDTYITINTANVISGELQNFDKKCTGSTDVFPYSEGSLMHYDDYDYSANGLPTITSKRGLAHLMGQRSGLAQSDVSTLNYIYKPYPPQGYNVVNSGGNALASWTALPGATQYAITYIERYEYHDNYGGNSWSQESRGGTYTVSANSANLGTYGNTTCIVYDDGYTTELYAYEVEIQGLFPDGIVGYVGRYAAPTGSC